jgi:hypothetical protein
MKRVLAPHLEGGGGGDARPLLALWCASVKYSARMDWQSGPGAMTELEETVSGGVFTGVMHPLLKSSAPLYLRAAAAALNQSQTENVRGILDEERVATMLDLLPLALLLLQRECDNSTNNAASAGSGNMASTTAPNSCALAAALRVLLSPRAVALLLSSGHAAMLKDACKAAEDASLALICTPAHLSVAEAGVDLMVHLAQVAPPVCVYVCVYVCVCACASARICAVCTRARAHTHTHRCIYGHAHVLVLFGNTDVLQAGEVQPMTRHDSP